ncbi:MULTISPECIES: hypothetical protein [unclassified Psychrobacillus]|uniref:hypothetical protein n=1 Tax=unclassified Psychrobacillus TaxID=2636677 RepID=UPI0030FC1344
MRIRPDEILFDLESYAIHVESERQRLFGDSGPEEILSRASNDHQAFRWATMYAVLGNVSGDIWEKHLGIVNAYLASSEGTEAFRESMKKQLNQKQGQATAYQVRTFWKDMTIYRLLTWKRILKENK